MVDVPENYRIGDATVVNRRFIRPIVNVDSGQTIDVDLGPVLQNLVNPSDVDNNGAVTPLDALLVINELIGRQFSDSEGNVIDPTDSGQLPENYFDQTGDGTITPLDALFVINELITGGSGGPISGQSLTVTQGRLSSLTFVEEEQDQVPGTFGATLESLSVEPITADPSDIATAAIEPLIDLIEADSDASPEAAIDQLLSETWFLESLL